MSNPDPNHEHTDACLERCCVATDGVHQPDWGSAQVAEDVGFKGVIVDVWCKHCGLSGSGKLTEVLWS